MDHSALSIFQDSANRMEEQRAPQPITEQMLSKSGEGTGKFGKFQMEILSSGLG